MLSAVWLTFIQFFCATEVKWSMKWNPQVYELTAITVQGTGFEQSKAAQLCVCPLHFDAQKTEKHKVPNWIVRQWKGTRQLGVSDS